MITTYQVWRRVICVQVLWHVWQWIFNDLTFSTNFPFSYLAILFNIYNYCFAYVPVSFVNLGEVLCSDSEHTLPCLFTCDSCACSAYFPFYWNIFSFISTLNVHVYLTWQYGPAKKLVSWLVNPIWPLSLWANGSHLIYIVQMQDIAKICSLSFTVSNTLDISLCQKVDYPFQNTQ